MSFLLIKIGQNDQNDVILNDPSIAPEHAEIFVDVEGNVFLTDLGTGKDTFVNGNKLVDSIELKSIDKVTFGTQIELDWKSALAINQPKTIKVGRSTSNDIIINASSVSENHLELIQDQNNSFFINDLSSEQGTYVNGNRISEIALLKAGDVVHVGDELFLWKSIFSNSEVESEVQVAFEANVQEELEIEIPVEKSTVEIVEEVIVNPNPVDFEVKSEEVDVTPEPINFVVEPIQQEFPKKPIEVEKPIEVVERPAERIENDTLTREKEIEKQELKKELIQLAVIVVVDVLMMMLISSMI